jgi:hypothetical protein
MPRRKGVGVLGKHAELVKRQELRQQPAAYEESLRPEVMCREPDHLILVNLAVCERDDNPKLSSGVTEYWILDRGVALRYRFLLWPYAPGDVDPVAVKRPAAAL